MIARVGGDPGQPSRLFLDIDYAQLHSFTFYIILLLGRSDVVSGCALVSL